MRKTVIALFKKQKSAEEIIEVTGFSERTVRETIRNYKRGGMAALKPKKRGRKSGEKRIGILRIPKTGVAMFICRNNKLTALPLGEGLSRVRPQPAARPGEGILVLRSPVSSFLHSFAALPGHPRRNAKKLKKSLKNSAALLPCSRPGRIKECTGNDAGNQTTGTTDRGGS